MSSSHNKSMLKIWRGIEGDKASAMQAAFAAGDDEAALRYADAADAAEEQVKEFARRTDGTRC